ncbi:MAG: FISUMP domain-containing protein [bacterium]
MDFISTFITKTISITFAIMLYGCTLIAQEMVTDIDGNIYNTVTIGTQVWMKENLKTTKYNNGDTIGTTHPAALYYFGEDTPKYQWAYEGNDSIAAIYGRLYTWHAITDSRKVCPTGWHVPTVVEWRTLVNFLGGEAAAHGKLKEAGTTHWKSPNSDATNESGFTGLPGGSHWDLEFVDIGTCGHYWSASGVNAEYAWRQLLNYRYMGANTIFGYAEKKIGWSVRCLRDTPVSVDDSNNGKHIPDEIKLNQNYPNPFNPSTNIQYSLSKPSQVKLSIYNMLGQKIKTLVDSFQNGSSYSIVWDATDDKNNPVCSGAYFYRLESSNTYVQKKMLVVR